MGVEESLGVGQGALGHARHLEPLLYGGDVEDIFDLPQAAEDRVEKGDEMSDHELIVAEAAVAVAAVVAEMLQLPVEQADKPPAHGLIPLLARDRGRAFGTHVALAGHAGH